MRRAAAIGSRGGKQPQQLIPKMRFIVQMQFYPISFERGDVGGGGGGGDVSRGALWDEIY